MYEVVKVAIEGNDKTYDYQTEEEVKLGDLVVVLNEKGETIGKIVKEKENIKLDFPPEKIKRKVTEIDKEKIEQNKQDAEKALNVAKEESKKLDLQMSFFKAEYFFNREQLIFYYTAEGRIDFRELAKKLSHIFHTRIELRQVGVRDKAKIIGGLGPCGRPLCCNSFLSSFQSVSINMAKNQNIALNASKINGNCGRLLCCLNYENELYEKMRKKLPKIDDFYKSPSFEGKVISVDILKGTIVLKNKEGIEKEVHIE